jgi:sugar phosphate isomerase/epimerase
MTRDLSFQLYSARNFPLDEVLATIAGLGYAQVEGFGGVFGDVPALKEKLTANGLTMPTAHVGLDELEKPDVTLKLAEELGLEAVICPWLHPGQRPADAAGWRRFGERLARLAEPYQQAGLTFGYHNHDFEFASFDGRYAMDILLEAAPNIGVEADVAWIARGGADPAPWLAANGDRIFAIHIKDIAAAGENVDEDGWADVGHGILPWQDLFKVIEDKVDARYFVAEHDNPKDIARFARRSIEAVRSYGV